VRALLAKAWDEQRRTLIGFGLGLVVAQAMYSAFYPAIRDSAADMQAFMDRMPEGFRELFGEEFVSPAGYLRTQLFGELGLILFLVVAIGAGARAIGGEEERRTLDILLSTPVRRTQVLASKWIAMLGLILALAAIGFVSVLVIGPVFELRVGAASLATASLMLALLAIAVGSIALAVSAATGKRTEAIAITTALVVAMYIINAIGVTVDALAPLGVLSLFRWYSKPPLFTGGLPVANIAVFVAVSVAAYLLARWGFDRRDLAS
jgi:ABC-2 type transport system permease protein